MTRTLRLIRLGLRSLSGFLAWRYDGARVNTADTASPVSFAVGRWAIPCATGSASAFTPVTATPHTPPPVAVLPSRGRGLN